MTKRLLIAVDADGTLWENAWPDIGEPDLEIMTALALVRATNRHRLILWTCREGDALADALRFCARRRLVFDFVNENAPDWIEGFDNDPRKVAADVYIDDRALHWGLDEDGLPQILGWRETTPHGGISARDAAVAWLRALAAEGAG